ncbi:unnamed protein product [Penicillium camemberti]|uniref:Str. FM013 n=1 Tax=Penicillium camemberti (strain FM 013) TaxID=1429867 RepID=A0A0G4P2Y4_PENC3|nr:unnamed protein product [Penicillium camemberti]
MHSRPRTGHSIAPIASLTGSARQGFYLDRPKKSPSPCAGALPRPHTQGA